MMDKARYLVELEKFLHSLSSDEKEDALEFYDEFITDADLKTRAEIEAKLGTPEQLSQKIISDYLGKQPTQPTKSHKWSAGKLILAIILLIILVPIVFAFICGVVGIALSFIIAIVVCWLTAVFVCALTLYSGIYLLFSVPIVGCFYLGVAFLAAAFCMIVLPLLYWLSKWCLLFGRRIIDFLKQKVQMMRN